MQPHKQHMRSPSKDETKQSDCEISRQRGSDGKPENTNQVMTSNGEGNGFSSGHSICAPFAGEVEGEVGSDNYISSLPESSGKARVVHWRDLIPFYRALRQMHGEIEFLKRATDDFYLRIEKARGDVREALEVKAKEEEILNRLEEVDRSMEGSYVRSREACEEAISAVHKSLWSAIEPLSELTTTALPGRLEKMEEERVEFLRKRKRQQLLVEKLQKQVVGLEKSLQTSQRDFKKETDKLKHELRRYQSKVEHLTQQMGGREIPHTTIGDLLSPFLTRRTEGERGVGTEVVCQEELKAAAASQMTAQAAAAKGSAQAQGTSLEELVRGSAERARSEFECAPSVSLCYSSSFPSPAPSVCLRKEDLLLEEKRGEPQDESGIRGGETRVGASSGLRRDSSTPVTGTEHNFDTSPVLDTEPAPGHNTQTSSSVSFVPVQNLQVFPSSSSFPFSMKEKEKDKEEEEEEPLSSSSSV
eukprot:Cvel_34222.t1-p1 / transcript=Cvel_34222.t1 / gene=Cvel_34222 / organism=Chromera_velia_CCMP2878 / gene_product=hypothetical protein / transcript_product=hypothetical protein / location=Cvel_scaffold5802:824-4354(+) / protein_length=472 / sequence_SO=supercontig / SO=protein_coding / is_pseudo=false